MAAVLQGRRVLVVEDEYLIASDLCEALARRGVEVVGPAPNVEQALALLDAGPRPDAAVLDINLQGERVFPVADALKTRGVPFLFASGYERWLTPEPHRAAPRLEKPVDPAAVLRTLEDLLRA